MEDLASDLSIIIVSSAVLSFIAVILKQPIIIAYIFCGMVLGIWINEPQLIENFSHLGITLLLFLAGLCLHPQKLLRLFKKTSIITLGNCLFSFVLTFVFCRLFNFNPIDSLCIGLSLMFSSTILVIKLLPTTRLHHEKMGALLIGVLILQDLIAISVLAFIRCLDAPQGAIISFILLSVKLAGFIGLLLIFEQFVLRKIMKRVESFHEILFVCGLAWCFGIASISHSMGLFYETGAFFAGVVLARHPISLFISEQLKPLRDFFLVLFFFTLGAKLDFQAMKEILLPSLLLAALFVLLKPIVLQKLFKFTGESNVFSKELGIRLGQLSEFSLLVAILAFELGHITHNAAQLIQLVTIITFIASSYFVVFKYPTPIGTKESLIRD